jgi:dihydrofolate reductase
MGKLSVTVFATLDGVIQAPGGPDEDRSGGFEHGGWMVPHFDQTLGTFIDEVFQRVDAFLLGRTTYEIFAGSWGQAADKGANSVVSRLNTLPKYVASRSLDKAEWNNSIVIRDVPTEVAELKQRVDGELQVHGSAGLIPTLTEHDLVDIYNIVTAPVFLGTGKRLFPEGPTAGALRLTGSQTTSTGVVICTYERAGKPTYGTAEVE